MGDDVVAALGLMGRVRARLAPGMDHRVDDQKSETNTKTDRQVAECIHDRFPLVIPATDPGVAWVLALVRLLGA
jgi:hypothetical protein